MLSEFTFELNEPDCALHETEAIAKTAKTTIAAFLLQLKKI
jgi:hypothetical protein